MFEPLTVALAESAVEPLYDLKMLDVWETWARDELQRDIDFSEEMASEEYLNAIKLGWFQRLAIPGTNLSTTSDHSKIALIDTDPLHNVGGRITSEEASILRPQAKWQYLKPHMPDMQGKTVLEAGANCGFFSFEFAKMGAAHVTGCDLVEDSINAATHIANELDCGSNIDFVCADFTHMPKAYDIVFMSEVLTHSPCPVSTIYSSVLLAKECLIFDDFFDRSDSTTLDFYIATRRTVWGPKDSTKDNGPWSAKSDPAEFIFLAASVSEKLLLTSLRIAGVLPEAVRRLHDPSVDRHSLIIVDTRGARERREKEIWGPYLRPMIGFERDG